MNTVEYGDVRFELPSNWDECTPEQYVKLCGLSSIFLSHKTIQPQEWMRIKEQALVTLVGAKPGFFFLPKKLKQLKSIPSEVLVCLTNEVGIMDWVFAPVKMTAYHLPNIKVKGVRYVGPDEHMCNVTAREFIDNHIDMILYQRSEDVKFLMSLLARLYRPLDANYLEHHNSTVPDRRKPYDAFTHKERMLVFKHHLSTEMVAAMFCQYAAHLHNFQQNFPNFWPQAENKTAQKKAQESNLQEYFLITKNLAGQTFGTMRETDQTAADIFFKEIDDRVFESKFKKK